MNYLKNFDSFVLEKVKVFDDIDKFFIIISGGYNKLSKFFEYKDQNNAVESLLFNVIEVNEKIIDDKDYKYNQEIINSIGDIPTLFFLGKYDNYDSYLDKLSNLYLNKVGLNISASKVVFSKVFCDRNWMPKTVFDVDNAINGAVGFPLIAKPEKGHSGIGINIFKNANELKDYKKTSKVNGVDVNFDLYSECLEIENEFRVYVANGKIFAINERLDEKDKSTMKTKKVDECTNFVYVEQDINKIPKKYIEKFNEIAQDIYKEYKDIKYFVYDVILDKNDKMYVLETNCAPGMNCNILYKLYLEMYKDYHKRDLDKYVRDYIENMYIKKFYAKQVELYGDFLNTSKWHIDFSNIK